MLFALGIIIALSISISFAQNIDTSETASQGAYQTGLTSSIPSTATTSQETQALGSVSQFAEYYTVPAAPTTHISAPVEYRVLDKAPSYLFFGSQMQPVPYSSYVLNQSNMTGNALWIQGSTNWTQYAGVPQGATVTLIAASPTGGSGYLNFIDSDGQTYRDSYYFFVPYSKMTFYADRPGRHILSYTIGNEVSNSVTIDVTGSYVPPSNYMPPSSNPSTYPGTQSFNYFPGFTGFGGGQIIGD
jgi:hypothetical protein